MSQFMRPRISSEREFFLHSDQLECSPLFMRYNNVSMVPVGDYDEDFESEDEELMDCVEQIRRELKIDYFDVTEEYWGNLSAPGYLDQTSYYLGDSMADVAQQLLDMFFDGESEYFDSDQKEDVRMLEGIIWDAKPLRGKLEDLIELIENVVNQIGDVEDSTTTLVERTNSLKSIVRAM